MRSKCDTRVSATRLSSPLARKHGVAIVMAGDSKYPQIADVTAKFVDARIMGMTEAFPQGGTTTRCDPRTERAPLGVRRHTEGS